MTGDEIGRARLAETLLSGDASKRVLCLRASAPESVPLAMPTDVPAVVDMAADMDMDIGALLEK